MEDKIFTKNKNDGLWERNPHLAFSRDLFIYLILFFGSIVVMAFNNIPGIVVAIWLILISIMSIVYIVHINQVRNMSKSTAFIKRNEKLYAIQLLYTKEITNQTSKTSMIYTPSGSGVQAATLVNNFKVAADVQAHEKELRERRQNTENFAIALDDILDYLIKKPKYYHVLPNNKRTMLDNVFVYNVVNNGMVYIETQNAKYKFLVLNNPRVTKQSKNNFVIDFYNEKNELCTAKFSNCYDNIIEEISINQ